MNEAVYDITIIGAGPTGLFSAFYGGMRQAKVKLIESLPHTGGQLMALYPEKYIYDVAGFPKIRAEDLIANLEEQVSTFDPTIVLGQSIKQVERLEDGSFKLTSSTGDSHYTKTIIIAAGNGAFEPRRLNVPGCSDLEGTHLHYHVDDMNRFKDEHVLLLGGGDSAVDWALMLEDIAKKVTLVHRRDQFRAHEHSLELLHNSSVDVLTPYAPKTIISGTKLENVLLKEVRGDKTIELQPDSIICNYGYISKLGPILEWELEIERNSIVVNSKMETNIPGIYAAGDVNTYSGKVKLIATGFGDAPIAVNNAMQYIDPDARRQPQFSTNMF